MIFGLASNARIYVNLRNSCLYGTLQTGDTTTILAFQLFIFLLQLLKYHQFARIHLANLQFFHPKFVFVFSLVHFEFSNQHFIS